MSLPHIAIIILHYKNLPDTRECLDSLKKVNYPSSLTPPPLLRPVPGLSRVSPRDIPEGRGLGGGFGWFSVIVVNNDILEHKTVLEAEYGDFIKIIQNSQNLGFCEGNNVGIRHVLADPKTDAVLLLNNDTVVEPEFLKEMVLKLDTHQALTPTLSRVQERGFGIDMVSPRMMQYHNRAKIDNLGIVLMLSGLPFNRTLESQKLFCPNGGCALYSRKLLEAIVIHHSNPHPTPLPSTGEGVLYFDPTYFAYCEDLDLGWRARNAGFEAAYAKDAIIYHKGSAIHGKLSDFAVYHTYRNLIWTQFKNMSWTMLLWQSPWLFLGWISLFAYYLIKGRAGLIIKACLDGLLGLRFMLNKRNAAKKTRTAKNKTIHLPMRQILSWFETGLFPKNVLK